MALSKFMICTIKNKVFECEAENVNSALDCYVEKALGFNKKFKTNKNSWGIFNRAVSSDSVKIALINGLCKYPADTIQAIINKSFTYLDDFEDDGIIYKISDDYTYAWVQDGTEVAGEVSIAANYRGLPVTDIGKEAFMNNTKVTKISIPESITSIKEKAFKNCSRLLAIEMPKTIKTIENYAFEGCELLQGIEIPDTVINLGVGVCKDCYSLESISLGSNVKSIEQAAFANCFNISDIKIPFGITSIGSEAFYECRGLRNIGIPSSVNIIDDGAFDFCSELKTIYYGGSKIRWSNVTIGEHNYASEFKDAIIYYNHDNEE